MNRLISRIVALCAFFVIAAILVPALAAEPRVQILSPKSGDRIAQEQNLIFVNGKIARDAGRSARVDILLVVDVSGST
jgi:hypothetical protein